MLLQAPVTHYALGPLVGFSVGCGVGSVVGASVGCATQVPHGPEVHFHPWGQPHFFAVHPASAQKQIPTAASHFPCSMTEQPNANVGTAVGSNVGAAVGFHVGVWLGWLDGLSVGATVGSDVGESDGAVVGNIVGASVGDAVHVPHAASEHM